jgi:hypothetical protein
MHQQLIYSFIKKNFMILIKKIHYYIIYIKLYKIDKLSQYHSKWIAEQIINHKYKKRK